MILNLSVLIDKYCQNKKITGVIHAGAHYGQEYDEYKNIATIKRMCFFECDPSAFRVLHRNLFGMPNVELYYCALGSTNAKRQLYRSSQNQGQSNSLLVPKIHLMQYPSIIFNETCLVEEVPLDDFKITDCNLLNMDVQGYELFVLYGAKETLKHIDYVYTEVNRAELYEGCAKVEEIDDLLSQYGFKRVETSWEGGTWGDAFYVKKNTF